MSTEKAVVDAPSEFSATELAALRERRDAVATQWVDAVRAEAQPGKDGEVSLEAGLSTETQEKIERLHREYQVLAASLKEGEKAKEQADLVKANEDLTSNAPRYRDLQAKREAAFFKDLMAVGQGEYRNEEPDSDPRAGAHPGALPIAQPLIARNPVTGKNQVYPVSAVFPGKNKEVSIEASFRKMEMIQADRFGQFDPLTGNKVGRHQAPVGKQLEADLGFDTGAPNVDEAVADTYLNQGGMLYLYEIQRNELAMYMDIKQVPYVNDFLIDRRTSVGTLTAKGLVEESGTIQPIDSAFDTITITPKKFAFLKGMSYESSRLQEPWSVAQTIMTDAGILMGNTFGEQIVTGDGTTGDRMAEQWEGLKTWAKASGNANNIALSSVANFLPTPSTNTSFGIPHLATFLTGLDKEYFRAPNKLLSMTLATWGKFQGVTDGERRKLFDSNTSLEDMVLTPWNIRVVIDENWDTGATAGDIPWFYGDFMSACFVMYGPVRVDYSMEYRFDTDRLYWRFIAHRGFRVVDPNGFKGGRIT